jgi:hypothetical protein
MAKRHVDALKAKQKKQKVVAAVLGVAFLGVLAFQGPKFWKQLHPPSQQARPSYNDAGATPGATPSLAAPGLGGGQTPTSTPSGSLASAPAPVVADGQLTSFSRFASKDPFAQQLSDKDGTPSGSSSSSGGGGGSSSGGGKSSSGGRGSASDPRPGTAVISLNGTLYTVAVGSDFPAASETDPSVVPLFHLVSLTAHTAKISIVGGSYANGAPAVTLRENKPVTLMNTADGTRYKLILKPVGTAVPGSSTPSTSSSSTSTAPSSSPTSTTVTLPPPSSP